MRICKTCWSRFTITITITRSEHQLLCNSGVSGRLGRHVHNKDTFVGTVHYMSPERVLGQKHSFDSDIYSLGLTIMVSFSPSQKSSHHYRLCGRHHHHVIIAISVVAVTITSSLPSPSPSLSRNVPLASIHIGLNSAGQKAKLRFGT